MSAPAIGAGSGSRARTKTYRKPVPANWWLQRWPYLRFMLREATSIPIAAFLVLLLLQVARLPGAGLLRSPLGIAVSVLALVAGIFHSITWHILSAQIFVFRLSEDYEVPRPVLMAVNFGAWLVVSAIVWGLAW